MTWFLIFAGTAFAWWFWREYRKRQDELNSPLADHRQGMRFIGQSLTLEKAIQNNSGQVFIGNREWQVRGPNLPVGSRVRVTGVDGSILLVDRTAS